MQLIAPASRFVSSWSPDGEIALAPTGSKRVSETGARMVKIKVPRLAPCRAAMPFLALFSTVKRSGPFPYSKQHCVLSAFRSMAACYSTPDQMLARLRTWLEAGGESWSEHDYRDANTILAALDEEPEAARALAVQCLAMRLQLASHLKLGEAS